MSERSPHHVLFHFWYNRTVCDVEKRRYNNEHREHLFRFSSRGFGKQGYQCQGKELYFQTHSFISLCGLMSLEVVNHKSLASHGVDSLILLFIYYTATIDNNSASIRYWNSLLLCMTKVDQNNIRNAHNNFNFEYTMCFV